MKMCDSFTWTLRGHYKVIKWPNFIVFVSQEIRRPKGVGRDWQIEIEMQGTATQGYILKFTAWHGQNSWHSKTII
jgi:hypothetical protein